MSKQNLKNIFRGGLEKICNSVSVGLYSHMNANLVHWGIIGFGAHAKKVMLPAFNEANSAVLSAIGSSTEEKLRAIEKTIPEVRCYKSYEAVLNDNDIEAVYIGLPNHLHYEWTLKALRAGKHVLCDKPLCLKLDEAKELKEIAEEHKLRCVEAFMYRFHPQHKKVKEIIAEGVLGDVKLFEAHFHFSLDDFQNIRLRPECGGGGLYDVGCYTIDAARFILGIEPASIQARWAIGKESRVDEWASMQLSFGDKEELVAHLTCGCRFGWENFYCVYGTKGSLRLEPAFTIPRKKPGKIALKLERTAVLYLDVPAANQYVLEIDAFSELIHGNVSDDVRFGAGIENLAVIEAAKRSAQKGSAELINLK